MKIEQVKLHHLRMRLKQPFVTSFGRIEWRESILVEVLADGLHGYGECVANSVPAYSSETVGTAWHILRDFLVPVLWNRSLPNPTALHEIIGWVRGHQMAKAGLEMALWDLAGKRQGKAVRTLLGGEIERVPVGVSVGIQASPQALVETVGRYVEDGYQRVKIKIKPGHDVVESAAVRAAFPDMPLQVDANSVYTLATAQALKPLDDLKLLLIEQPLAEDDLWDHSQLQKEFTTPLCLDESIESVRQARQALEMEACRVINIKPGRVGGLSQGVAIHDLCQAAGVPVWCGGMLETGVGRAANLALASLPNFKLPGDISASDRYYEQDITQEMFSLNDDSTITVPDKPGLGVTVDMAALQQATQAELTLKA